MTKTKPITDTDLNTMLAQACGWTNPDVLCQAGDMHPPGSGRLEPPPRYCSNANAVAEARRVLLTTQELKVKFLNCLGSVIVRSKFRLVSTYDVVDSSPHDQALALVRALGLGEKQ